MVLLIIGLCKSKEISDELKKTEIIFKLNESYRISGKMFN